MDKIDKSLLKLSDKQRNKLLESFKLVVEKETTGLNIKKLKGQKGLFRLRVGDARLIYRIDPKCDKPIIVYIGKRDDQTYRKL
jgi:mRNA-degrading endonuclease RelE of RelBE toxin-antitoxin system